MYLQILTNAVFASMNSIKNKLDVIEHISKIGIRKAFAGFELDYIP